MFIINAFLIFRIWLVEPTDIIKYGWVDSFLYIRFTPLPLLKVSTLVPRLGLLRLLLQLALHPLLSMLP